MEVLLSCSQCQRAGTVLIRMSALPLVDLGAVSIPMLTTDFLICIHRSLVRRSLLEEM